MAKLYFRYGNGKSAHLCQVAYNYLNEREMNIAIINAENYDTISSKVMVDGKNLLEREPNLNLENGSLYE